jgi:asparagine synthase (glutamine-hydrolysing)
MCGIAGVYGVSDEARVNRMIDAQVHRGPDGRGIWSESEKPVTFGHCRLSIIDTSSLGHQPMSYDNERLWITYNGELYNFKELRLELESLSYSFNSNSDTEVVLAAYKQWGTECLKKFRGMFAFALVDKNPPSGWPDFLLVRDRFGIKPLLYFEHKSEIWFSSELRGLLASGRVDRKIDQKALLDYLGVGAVFQNRTIIKGVKSLLPGHFMEIRGQEKKIVRYWDLHENTKTLREELKDISTNKALSHLSVLLQEAAKYNLVSDVQVGAFLSGGIDSTAVVGLMGDKSNKKIKTFSVGFDQENQTIDERGFAKLASKHLDCEFKEIIVSSSDAKKIFSQIISDIDQPSIDGTNTWIVSQAASNSVKVALSGLGGDELFAGYEHFKWLTQKRMSIFDSYPKILNAIEKVHVFRPNFMTRNLLFKIASSAKRLSMLRRIISDFDSKKILNPKLQSSFAEHFINHQKQYLRTDADKIQQTSYAEIRGYLLSTLLRDGDIMSMAHGLEVRPMLLDHPLVEYIYALPEKFKSDKYEDKSFFIESVLKYFPPELKNRKKMGFELPFIHWMAGDLKPQFEELLNSQNAHTIFQSSYIKKTTQSLQKGNPPRALWAWGILLAWLEKYQLKIV